MAVAVKSKKKSVKKTHRPLPKKPSRSIRSALKDLRAVENIPKTCIDMDYVLKFDGSGGCVACLAGCVMKCMGVRTSQSHLPMRGDGVVSDWNAKVLAALDYFRQGGSAIANGLNLMGIHNIPDRLSRVIRNFKVPPYPDEYVFRDEGYGGYLQAVERFHEAMEKMAALFEKEGL